MENKIRVLQTLGTPYEEGFEKKAAVHARAQAKEIVERLKVAGIEEAGLEKKEIIALIAYLQRLGTDIKK